MNNIVILLTGTINVNNMIFTTLKSSEDRKKQYINSIKFWLETTECPIVFVENSGVDLSDYFSSNILDGRLEVIFFEGNNYDRALGKGYGEIMCIEYAFKKSELLKKSTFIFKTTGRLKILNFQSFHKHLLCNPKTNIFLEFKCFFRYTDSRFFGFTPNFLNYLLPLKESLHDSKKCFFEHILAIAALQSMASGYYYLPFKDYLNVEGFSGSSGYNYKSNFLKRHILSFVYNISYYIHLTQTKKIERTNSEL